MTQMKKPHTAECKLKIALEAILCEKTLAELWHC